MNQPRNFFVERLQDTLIGPGGDVFGLPSEEELISSLPLQTYHSAILFPERKTPESEEEKDVSNLIATLSQDSEMPGTPYDSEQFDFSMPTGGKRQEAQEIYQEANSYFPTNCGLTFCVNQEVREVKVEFSAGRYELLDWKSHERWERVRVLISQLDFDILKNDPAFPFADLLQYEALDENQGYFWLSQKPAENQREVLKRLAEYSKDSAERNKMALRRFELLYTGRISRRIPLWSGELILPVQDTTEPIPVFAGKDGVAIAKYWVKVIPSNGKNYIKILLANTAEKHPSNKFSLGKETLNEKCLFQVKIAVHAPLQPCKDRLFINDLDPEAATVAFQHRHLHTFGIGHGCAVNWSGGESPVKIETTFLPKAIIPKVSNGFRKGQDEFKEIAILKNLSVWSPFSQKEICRRLFRFADSYAAWITEQKTQLAELDPDSRRLAEKILQKQEANFERLYRNIDLLQSNQKVFDCFRLANTAMFIQIFISLDKRFGKEEKTLADFAPLLQKYPGLSYSELDFFQKNLPIDDNSNEIVLSYRPFQLAFFLLNLEGIVNEEASDRELVDLLWFPTGGGKTEAYLALTAFTIFWRRINHPGKGEGVSVIMRYTLRLLTAQQFERASRLVCALEFLRENQNKLPEEHLRRLAFGERIGIGLWVGEATTPNTLELAREKLGTGNNPNWKSLKHTLNQMNSGEDVSTATAENRNVFQVSACPWCGCKLISKQPETGMHRAGFEVDKTRFLVKCLNRRCAFQKEIPLDVVDESIYNQVPSLLFATVDKFAQLAHREEGHVFFDSIARQKLPPDLIIQDELHLLNGPLGSIVGLFETIVELLCSRGQRRPKIIASTATTRNTDEQVKALYGGRSVNVFPPPGLTYDDNYFYFIEKDEGRRLHIGFMPTGKTFADTQVRTVLPQLLLSRLILYKQFREAGYDAVKKIDPYWTIVSYHNTLKEVGKVYNKVGDEILAELKRLHRQYGMDSDDLNFNHFGLVSRTEELTSRIPSTRIKATLKDLETPFQIEEKKGEEDRIFLNVKDTVDLVLASNMFSVGIDIGRLNLMLMNGLPKNMAEYIQASSRVARSDAGLVINLMDANRAREKSFFEHYRPFHDSYYRFVEPLTVTPFTEVAFEKVLNAILVTYVKHVQGHNRDKDANEFDGNIEQLLGWLRERIPEDEARLMAERHLRSLAKEWLQKIQDKKSSKDHLVYKHGLIEPSTAEGDWALMNSMREIDTLSLIEIQILKNTTRHDIEAEIQNR
jgi:hypothetical protein